MPKRKVHMAVLEDIIKKFLFPDIPWKVDSIYWDDKHKKVVGMDYSKEFRKYLRQREEIEERFLEYGITKDRFLEVWEELIEDDEDSELVRRYFRGERFAELGRKFFMDETTISRKIEKFLKKFFRALFV